LTNSHRRAILCSVAGYIATSKTVHWNTLPSDLVLVRRVLGPICTDPCSNRGSEVGALFEYTEEDDGLSFPWFRNFFVNPPFGPLAPRFFSRALSEMENGNVSEGIFFVPARVDTRWFHAFAMQASAICFVKGRRRFRQIDEEEAAEAAAPFPVLFVYFGPNAELFREVFAEEGAIFTPTPEQRLKAEELAGTLRDMGKKDDLALATNIALSLELKRHIRVVVKDEVEKQMSARSKTKTKKKTKHVVKGEPVAVSKLGGRVYKVVEKLCNGKKSRSPKSPESVDGKSCSMVEICKALRMMDAGATEKQKVRRILANNKGIGQIGATRSSVYFLRA
jgi:hypothetical protein